MDGPAGVSPGRKASSCFGDSIPATGNAAFADSSTAIRELCATSSPLLSSKALAAPCGQPSAPHIALGATSRLSNDTGPAEDPAPLPVRRKVPGQGSSRIASSSLTAMDFIPSGEVEPVPLSFRRLEVPGLVLVEAKSFKDGRGCFTEVFRESQFMENGMRARFVQDNHSHSVKGVLRGLHYQLNPGAQAKFVFVTRGEVFDVAVDIRRNSRTYGRWVGETLSAENRRGMYVPEGFAHGFCVLSEEADVIYKVTREYAPGLERGIRWDDRELGIAWPVKYPILSERDSSLPLLRDAENNFQFAETTGVKPA